VADEIYWGGETLIPRVARVRAHVWCPEDIGDPLGQRVQVRIGGHGLGGGVIFNGVVTGFETLPDPVSGEPRRYAVVEGEL
jgi:hypothetical protein